MLLWVLFSKLLLISILVGYRLFMLWPLLLLKHFHRWFGRSRALYNVVEVTAFSANLRSAANADCFTSNASDEILFRVAFGAPFFPLLFASLTCYLLPNINEKQVAKSENELQSQ